MFSRILEVTLPVFGIDALGYLYGRMNGSEMDSASLIVIPVSLVFIL